jgi:hypothetical protein
MYNASSARLAAEDAVIDFLQDHPHSTASEMFDHFFPKPKEFERQDMYYAMWRLIDADVVELDLGRGLLRLADISVAPYDET